MDSGEEKRRDTALGLSELSCWIKDLSALNNPVRREFHLCLLLSGSRPDALKRAKVEHVDFRNRILHVPKPKGGEVKAFDIPLSRAMIGVFSAFHAPRAGFVSNTGGRMAVPG